MEPATMAILGSGLASAFGNVYSNTLNAANAAKINQKNLDLQAAINLDNIEAARLNNVTAVDLANTAHQREVRDLRDAGLNPILSATGGNGASTPSLQSPNLDAPSLDRVDVVNPLSEITSAVGQAMQYEDSHRLNMLQSRLLDSSLPDNIGVLKEQAHQEAASAIQRAKADHAQAQYDEMLNKLRTEILDNGLHEMVRGGDRVWRKFPRYSGNDIYRPDNNFARLVYEGILSDLKDQSNRNWRNNTAAAAGALNSASSALGSLGRGAATMSKAGGMFRFFRSVFR